MTSPIYKYYGIRDTDHLEESEIRVAHVIEVDIAVHPRVVLHVAFSFVVNNLKIENIIMKT